LLRFRPQMTTVNRRLLGYPTPRSRNVGEPLLVSAKNALATLHGYAQFLQHPVLTEDARLDAAAALLQEVRSLAGMVTSFLNFARPSPLDVSEISLREVFEHCASELRVLYAERHVTLRLDGALPDIRADERMLRQALLNLLRNAAEAIGDNESNKSVVVRGDAERDPDGNEWAKIEIADTGAGIAEEDIRRIFIPFFTTKAKGHGVGLALAHRVVTDHGGTLTVANAPEGGAVFTVRLPALPA